MGCTTGSRRFTVGFVFVSWVLFTICFFPLSVHAFELKHVDIYGRLNVSYQYEHNEISGNVWKLESNASRLGFKGEAALDQGLTLRYQIEYGVEVDDGDKNGQTITQRDSFVGLRGSWGQLLGGKITIPFKEAKGPFDRFNDLQGELGKIIDGEERLDNVLQYDSQQVFGPLVLTLAIVPGENADDSSEDGPADGMSGSLVFNQQQFYLGLGFNANIKQQDQWRIVSGWTFERAEDSLSVGALYQYSEISETDVSYVDGKESANAYGVSMAYTRLSNTFNAQWVKSERSASLSDASQLSFGVDHQLGAHSTLYGYYTRRHADENEQQNRYLAIGLKHNF